MATDNFCFYLQNRLIQTSQTGGQWYSDTSPFGTGHCFFTCDVFDLGDAFQDFFKLRRELGTGLEKKAFFLWLKFWMIVISK